MGHLRWVLLLFCVFHFVQSDSLYDASDPIQELHNDNFDTEVYGQKKAFFVEFYSSWCGACIGYAPTFKKFARQLASWQPLVQVSVVNCADDKNMPLCRTHQINSFPTLKYFKYMSSSKDDGQLYQGDKHSLPTLSLDVAELAKADYDLQKPAEWPSFEPTSDETSMDSVWASTSTPYIVLVVEEDPAKYAWASIINWNKDRHVRSVLVRSSHPEAKRLNLLPGKIVVLQKANPVPVFTNTDGQSWADVQEKVNELVSAAPVENVAVPAQQDSGAIAAPVVAASDLSQYQVQMVDLQSALGYMLTKEIVRREVIDGENLSAVKLWINTLNKYYPGTVPTRRFLYRLNEWLQLKMGQVTAEEWTNKINELQRDLGNPIPTQTTWLTCKGSKSNLRGYTCGLWTLAHTVAAEAYKQSQQKTDFSPVNEVLEPWRQFITRFLSCKECAENFEKESQTHQLALVTRKEDVVMWLWKVHNSVNKRLSGSPSDDPKYPKQQFPPKALCTHCYTPSGELDEAETLKFVLSYYGDVRTDPAEPAPAYKMSEFQDGKLQRAASRRLNPKFAVHADKVDQMEEAEARLRAENLDTNPQRAWRDIDGYGSIERQSRGYFYLIWLSVIAVLLVIAYCKYKRNRSKFWKQFYYHNDFKLPFHRAEKENVA